MLNKIPINITKVLIRKSILHINYTMNPEGKHLAIRIINISIMATLTLDFHRIFTELIQSIIWN